MKALVVNPLARNSARLLEIDEPVLSGREQLLVELVCVGVCGTDREIVQARYGSPPSDSDYLILGHESLSRVISAPPQCDFHVGDLVVGIVRHPDPIPCPNCRIGEWDMCQNGLYTEHGIKGLHGFCRERFTLDPEHAVKVDASLGELGVLLEPASILAKAWEHIERIGNRALFHPKRALVTGAGSVGLLAALMGRSRDLEVWVLDKVSEGKKPELVKRLGARYITDLSQLESRGPAFDIAIECTGVPELVIEVMKRIGPGGIACLTGVSSGGRLIQLDAGSWNREIVLENGAVFGSVNANRRHYEKAAGILASADSAWLRDMLSLRVPLDGWRTAFENHSGDLIKITITGPAYAKIDSGKH